MVNKVAVLGASMWAQRLAGVLEVYTSLTCAPVSDVAFKDAFLLLKAVFTPVIVRVGFRPGQLRPRGILLDIISLLGIVLGRRLIFYWTGSDIPRTAKLLNSKSWASRIWSIPVSRFLLRNSRHCVAAPWLANELAELGCDARCLPFPTPTKAFEQAGSLQPAWPDKFIVLSYIPDHNYQNYCGEELVQLALRMPEVTFRVMGGEGTWCFDCPQNLEFLGWADALEQYIESVVVVRAVRHDALGGTVREALLCGRYVLYTLPHEHTYTLPGPDAPGDFLVAMEKSLGEILQRFQNGSLPLNMAGRQWVLNNLSERCLAKSVAAFIFEDSDV